MLKKIILLLSVSFLASCTATRPQIITKKAQANKTKKPISYNSKNNSSAINQSTTATEVIQSTSKTVVTNEVVYGYISDFNEVAMGNMKKYGIPASIILAQGILESGAGRGDLVLSGNNHFGIKCHKNWTGPAVYHDDDASQECFRKYNDPAESYKDHAVFLTTGTRYASLFSLPQGDYVGWARGLRAAGYATDIKYPEKLISYIERYGLHRFDEQVLGKSQEERVVADIKKTNQTLPNPADWYEVQPSDTLYSISKKFNTTVDVLKQINALSDNALSIGQKIQIK